MYINVYSSHSSSPPPVLEVLAVVVVVVVVSLCFCRVRVPLTSTPLTSQVEPLVTTRSSDAAVAPSTVRSSSTSAPSTTFRRPLAGESSARSAACVSAAVGVAVGSCS